MNIGPHEWKWFHTPSCVVRGDWMGRSFGWDGKKTRSRVVFWKQIFQFVLSCTLFQRNLNFFFQTALILSLKKIYWSKFLTPHFYISKVWKLRQNLWSIDIDIVCGLHGWTVKVQKNCNRICNYSTVTVIVEKHVERFWYVFWVYLLQIVYPHIL
jgi:hypothetical protein